MGRCRVELGEHPRTTALRELKEELSVSGNFLIEKPILLTSTVTVGKTAGHTDVSLWYAVQGDRNLDYRFDHSEFRSIRWFHKNELPLDRCDPQLHRFTKKLFAQKFS
ncbi:MAG: NUDIX hydrolase [Chloroflexota bacterium]